MPTAAPQKHSFQGVREKAQHVLEKAKEKVTETAQSTKQATEGKFAEHLAKSLLSDLNASFRGILIYIGGRLGLFNVLNQRDSDGKLQWFTVDDFVNKAGNIHFRYAQEWLEAMVANDILSFKTGPRGENLFSLPETYSYVFCDENHTAYSLPLMSMIPSISRLIPDLENIFQSGEGLSYEKFGKEISLDAIGGYNKHMYVQNYIDNWLPKMPDIVEKLQSGIRVLDVGCGIGISTIELLKRYPNCRVTCIEPDRVTFEKLQKNLENEGFLAHVDLVNEPMEDFDFTKTDHRFDFVTIFEALHLFPFPVKALHNIKNLLVPGGTLLIAGLLAHDNLKDNVNEMGSFCYNVNLLHVLPQLMSFNSTDTFGTIMGPKRVEDYILQAGFKGLEVLNIRNLWWRFYRVNLV